MDCSPFRPFDLALGRTWTLAIAGGLAIVGVASPAAAARETSARLVECGEEDCLLVSGYRADPTVIVAINGRAVEVEGQYRWRARLPVETLRAWSSPDARTIAVSQGEATDSVDLPVGMLGRLTDLAALEVRVR